MGACLSSQENAEDKIIYANYEHLEHLNGPILRKKISHEKYRTKTSTSLQWNQAEVNRKLWVASKKRESESDVLDRFIAEIYAETTQKKEKIDILEQNYHDLKASLPATLKKFEFPVIMKKNNRSSIMGKFIHFSDH